MAGPTRVSREEDLRAHLRVGRTAARAQHFQAFYIGDLRRLFERESDNILSLVFHPGRFVIVVAAVDDGTGREFELRLRFLKVAAEHVIERRGFPYPVA